MRKITKQMQDAFVCSNNYKKDNTQVVVSDLKTQVFLFNNLIAEQTEEGLKISNCGWKSNTTKERLNALPNVSINQKRGVWYLNGVEWDGEFINVNN